MLFMKTTPSAIEPTKSLTCFNSQCYDLFFPEDFVLLPNTVNVVDTKLATIVPAGDMMVVHHLQNSSLLEIYPWKIATNLIFTNPSTGVIFVPVITSVPQLIPAGTPLLHFQLQKIADHVIRHQGMLLIYYSKKKISNIKKNFVLF